MAGQRAKVLVVDDERNLLLVLQRWLERKGYDVKTSTDGKKALALIDAEAPDVVVLDARMPGLDGFEVLAAIRRRFDMLELPVIMLSALGSEEAITRGYELGANDFVEKPATGEGLAAKVSVLLRKRDIRRLLRLAADGDGALREGAASLAGKVRIGPYTIGRFVGAGTSGFVFRAVRDGAPSGREVALKVLTRPSSDDPTYLRRFAREAEVLEKLAHRNIVRLLDAGHHLGYYYYAMRFVDSRSLRDLVESEGRLGEACVRGIARDLAKALAYLARRNILHRDLKPGNVLIERATGRARLTDFGLARPSGAAALTERGFVIGTPSYMAPERILAEGPEDARADLYSLGATLYHALAGEPPFPGAETIPVLLRCLSEPVPRLEERAPGVSAGMAGIVQRLLSKDVSQRFPSARQLLRSLGELPPLAASDAGAASKDAASSSARP